MQERNLEWNFKETFEPGNRSDQARIIAILPQSHQDTHQYTSECSFRNVISQTEAKDFGSKKCKSGTNQRRECGNDENHQDESLRSPH